MSLAPRIDRLENNSFINGNLDFWQRVAGNVTNATGTGNSSGFTADRISYYFNTTASKNVSIVRSTIVPTYLQSGFNATYSYQVTNNSAITLSGASDYYIPWDYNMEGYDYARFHNGNTMYVSFWFFANNAGVYPLSFRNSALDRSYVTTFNYTSANTWQFIEVSLQTDTAGTWLLDNNRGIVIGMSWGATAWKIPSLNTWTTGSANPSYLAAPDSAGVFNMPGTAGAFFRMALMSITAESMSGTNKKFSRAGRSVQNELALCQRYYEKSYDQEVIPSSITQIGNLSFAGYGGGQQVNLPYKATKRTTPTTTVYNPATGATGTARNANAGTDMTMSLNSTGISTAQYGTAVSTTSGQGYFMHWTADAEF